MQNITNSAQNSFFRKNKTTIKQPQLTPVYIYISNNFTDEMDSLRKIAFPSDKPMITCRDQFDDRSQHLIISINNTVAAYGRLTPGPNSVFEAWTQGKAEIPTGEDTIDFGRCFVNPKFQSLGLFELVCVVGLIHSKNLGFKNVVGTYVLGSKTATKIYKVGFEDSGPQLTAEGTEKTATVQPVLCKPEDKYHLWPEILKSNAEYLQAKGFLLVDYLPRVAGELKTINSGLMS